jgi:hypothetical protein
MKYQSIANRASMRRDLKAMEQGFIVPSWRITCGCKTRQCGRPGAMTAVRERAFVGYGTEVICHCYIRKTSKA